MHDIVRHYQHSDVDLIRREGLISAHAWFYTLEWKKQKFQLGVWLYTAIVLAPHVIRGLTS